jgi:hypothetical protein
MWAEIAAFGDGALPIVIEMQPEIRARFVLGQICFKPSARLCLIVRSSANNSRNIMSYSLAVVDAPAFEGLVEGLGPIAPASRRAEISVGR